MSEELLRRFPCPQVRGEVRLGCRAGEWASALQQKLMACRNCGSSPPLQNGTMRLRGEKLKMHNALGAESSLGLKWCN